MQKMLYFFKIPFFRGSPLCKRNVQSICFPKIRIFQGVPFNYTKKQTLRLLYILVFLPPSPKKNNNKTTNKTNKMYEA